MIGGGLCRARCGSVIGMGLAEDLLSRNPTLSAALARCAVVDDVLADNIVVPPPENKAGSSKYLPRGRAELEGQYLDRIGMTPWLPRTPQILQDRHGALFSDPPTLECEDENQKEKFAAFELSASPKGEPLVDVIGKCSDKIQRHGFCVLVLDRAPLPGDLKGRPVTVQDVRTRKLSAPRIAIYSAKDVLDLNYDDAGKLAWVKVQESRMVRGAWSAKPRQIVTVRVIDDVLIRSWQIEQKAAGEEKTVTPLPDVQHGWKDSDGNAALPCVLAQAFAGEDGIGRPSLLGPAQADVSATRLLSDLIWCLFVAGQPMLCLKTQREADEFEKCMKRGVSRYITLKSAGIDGEEESLEYVQLDVNGIGVQREMYERFVIEADAQAGKDAPGAMTQPVSAESGVARAWKFKTGQERVLFILTRSLEAAFNYLIDLLAVEFGADPGKVRLRFNQDFDTDSPKESVDVATSILPIVEKSATATAFIRADVLERVYPNMPDMEKIRAELSAEDTALNAPDGSVDAVDAVGKIPLGLQQLALARERANTAGDKQLSAALAKKMKDLIGSLDV